MTIAFWTHRRPASSKIPTATNSWSTPRPTLVSDATFAPSTSTRSMRFLTRAGSPIESDAGHERGEIGEDRIASSASIDWLEGFRRQEHRHSARFPHDRPAGPDLPDRGRSAFDPEIASRRRNDRHRLLPCVRLQRRRGISPRSIGNLSLSPTRPRSAIRSTATARSRSNPISTGYSIAPRGCENGRFAYSSADSPPEQPLGNFRYHGTSPTTRTISFHMSTGASCVAPWSSAPG